MISFDSVPFVREIICTMFGGDSSIDNGLVLRFLFSQGPSRALGRPREPLGEIGCLFQAKKFEEGSTLGIFGGFVAGTEKSEPGT